MILISCGATSIVNSMSNSFVISVYENDLSKTNSESNIEPNSRQRVSPYLTNNHPWKSKHRLNVMDTVNDEPTVRLLNENSRIWSLAQIQL